MSIDNPWHSDAANDLAALTRKIEVLELVLGESTDPIFNILKDGTYRYVNRAFSTPFRLEPEEVIGKKIWDLFSKDEAEKRMSVVLRAFASGETIVFDVRVPTALGDTFYITSVKPIRDDQGHVSSVVCISKDITERKRIDREREQLILDLKTALQDVKTLSGLLPICAQCKKIRDDHGYWTQLEAYIRDHSQADFTHGICPQCAETLYPDLPRKPER